MTPETMKSSFSDLVTLAEKVAALNPDAERIGPGMLRELVSLARKALGDGASEAAKWVEDESHWTDPETGERFVAFNEHGCDKCSMKYMTPQCKRAPNCMGIQWRRASP